MPRAPALLVGVAVVAQLSFGTAHAQAGSCAAAGSRTVAETSEVRVYVQRGDRRERRRYVGCHRPSGQRIVLGRGLRFVGAAGHFAAFSTGGSVLRVDLRPGGDIRGKSVGRRWAVRGVAVNSDGYYAWAAETRSKRTCSWQLWIHEAGGFRDLDAGLAQQIEPCTLGRLRMTRYVVAWGWGRVDVNTLDCSRPGAKTVVETDLVRIFDVVTTEWRYTWACNRLSGRRTLLNRDLRAVMDENGYLPGDWIGDFRVAGSYAAYVRRVPYDVEDELEKVERVDVRTGEIVRAEDQELSEEVLQLVVNETGHFGWAVIDRYYDGRDECAARIWLYDSRGFTNVDTYARHPSESRAACHTESMFISADTLSWVRNGVAGSTDIE